MEYIRSAFAFFGGVIKRWYYWAFALLLDPFDLYDRFIKPELSGQWQTDIAMPTEFGLVALILLLFWAAVCTYHEARIKGVVRGDYRPNMLLEKAVSYLMDEADLTLLPSRFGGDSTGYLEALAQLTEAARDGRLIFWGICQGERTRRRISKDEWESRDIVPFEDRGDPMNPQTGSSRENYISSAQQFYSLFVDEKQLKEIWPRPNFLVRIIGRG